MPVRATASAAPTNPRRDGPPVCPHGLAEWHAESAGNQLPAQFKVFGDVVWGARTLHGADQAASQWKNVPIRRMALFLEASLYSGTQWVVFEPNDETLWGQIRLNVGAFMQRLFLQGAFQGTTPEQAYFVKCAAENNSQSSIDEGVVNILVSFAPLYPAEFVVIQIQQIAGCQNVTGG